MNVIARLNHKLMPTDRGDRYEDPLNEELEEKGFGSVDGGGTLMEKSKEIQFIELELNLLQTEKSIPFVIERPESYGAPKGSKLMISDGDNDKEIPFGKAEGVGIYLDGVNLAPEVYESCDVNIVISEIDRLVEGHGSIEAYWEGNAETALYIYGDDAEVMKNLITDYLASYRL